MRSFIIALIILFAVLISTVCNSICVTNNINEMLDVCEKLQLNSSVLLTDELNSKWQSCRDIISLTTRQGDIERAESAILSLEHYLDIPADYKVQLAILVSTLEHIKASHALSPISIF